MGSVEGMVDENAAAQIRALIVPSHGGPDVFELRTLPQPEPGPGQLLVRVAASGINFKDVYEREGSYPRDTPFTLGDEFAGEVTAIGPDVSGFAVGDRVAGAKGLGTHASACLVDAAQAVHVPDGIELDLAAAVMLQGMTAHYLVNSTYPLQAGETALIHAAAGGLGQLTVQLAKARGARVIATVGSEEKVAIAASRGADEIIRYDEVDDLAAAVRAANGGAGVDVVYDSVGRSTFDASLGSLRRRGTLALVGAASGPVPPLDPQRLNSGGSLYLTRPTLAHYIATRDELEWRTGDLFAAIADGSLDVSIGGRYPLDEAAEAYRALEGRRSTGKLLLIP